MSINKHKHCACNKHNACDVDTGYCHAYEQKVTPDPIYKQIGAVIKARRKTLGLKQENLASLLSISRGSLANIETGRQNVLVHQLYKFAAVLKLTPFDLLPPPAVNQPRGERTELPLPDDLKAQQKEQITRLFEQVEAEQPKDREASRAKSFKR
jgi:transcriptional regulator with XRE-family HTH domain